MNIKGHDQIRVAFLIALTLLMAGGFLYAAESFSFGASSELDYFKGDWTVTMRSNPKTSFRWTVKEDLNGSWMAGVVEQDGNKVSTDFWRRDGKQIERFAFTSDGTFVRINSSGWKSNQLLLTGIASDKAGEVKIRETITRVNDRQFYALWEKESLDGRWTVFADEICIRR